VLQPVVHRAPRQHAARAPNSIISRTCNNILSGMPLAKVCIMNINSRILHEIAFQIETGNPLWGVLFMNEYLTDDNWLRKAFETRLKGRLKNAPALTSSTLLNKLLSGAKAAELSEEERVSIGARHTPARRFIPKPRPIHQRDAHRRRATTMSQTHTSAATHSTPDLLPFVSRL
jgi:hypothetical protein